MKTSYRRLVLLSFILAFSSETFSADSGGHVVRVLDGDTLEILTEEKKRVRVRLSEIDAPERGQAFGTRSREALSALCAGADAVLSNQGKDRYKRVLARVTCNGIDANASMVSQGMAWVYDQYAEDEELYKLQARARELGLGLWVEPGSVPPWLFRRGARKTQP